MKKICMVLGNPFVNDNRVLREAGTLAKDGFKVRLFASYGVGLPSYEKVDGFEVIRLPVKNYSPYRLKMYPYYTEFYKSYKKLVSERADFYHCHDLDTLLLGYLVGKKTGAKIIYDTHEYWPSRTKFARNVLDYIKGYIREPFFHLMERFLINRVDVVISANETSASALSKHYNIEKPKTIYNYHSFKNKIESNVLKESLNLMGKKVILFLGGINKGRGVLQLLEALVYLPSDYHLVFLGQGPYKEKLQKMAQKLSLNERLHFPKAVPPKDVVKWASSADVGISPIQNVSKSYYFSSPNKVFEYLMAGLPIAVSDFPEMRKILSRHEVGETFNPDDPKSIAKAIKKILFDGTRYKEMKKNALRAAKEEYNWEKESKKLLRLYRKLS